MNVQRITISMPAQTYKELRARVNGGNVSEFVTNTIEEKLLDDLDDPIDRFLKMREKTKKISSKEILSAIRKGRT